MSERKPPDATWASWIERQIEAGRRDGAFDDLPGHGSPIDDLDRPHDDLWWVKAKMQREDVAVTPPTIAIRTERDAVVEAAMSASSATEVRQLIEGLNERIRDVNRFVTWGPPSSVAPLDVDVVLYRWRQSQPPSAPSPAEPTAVDARDATDASSTRCDRLVQFLQRLGPGRDRDRSRRR